MAKIPCYGLYLRLWFISEAVIYIWGCDLYPRLWFISEPVVYIGACAWYRRLWCSVYRASVCLSQSMTAVVACILRSSLIRVPRPLVPAATTSMYSLGPAINTSFSASLQWYKWRMMAKHQHCWPNYIYGLQPCTEMYSHLPRVQFVNTSCPNAPPTNLIW